MVASPAAPLAAPDGGEHEIAQWPWACYKCGSVVEESRPEPGPSRDGAGLEFEGLGPFYVMSPEYLGQLQPTEIVDLLDCVPHEAAPSAAERANGQLCVS